MRGATMESIIESLFYDKYEVHTSKTVSPEYKDCLEKLSPYYDRIREEFGKTYFDECYSAIMSLSDRENLYFFQKGIQLGGQIMLIVLGPEPDC